MMRGFTAIFLLTIFAQCYSIEVLVNGEATTRTVFCAGESLTLVCPSANALTAFVWTIPPNIIGTSLQVTMASPTFAIDIFTATFVSPRESRLMFDVDADTNGSVITCRDSIGNVDLTSITINLHGLPTAPEVVLTQNSDLTSFTVGVTSTSATICVQQYNITLNTGTGSFMVFAVPANVSTFDVATLFNQSLEICTSTYTISVVASLGGGTATSTGVINFQAIAPINGTANSTSITLNAPDFLQNCITNYTYSFQGYSGVIDPSENVIMLSMFNTTQCTNPTLTIDPIIMGEARISLRYSLSICTIDASTTIEKATASTTPLDTSTSSTTPPDTSTSSAARVTGAHAGFMGLLVLAAMSVLV